MHINIRPKILIYLRKKSFLKMNNQDHPLLLDTYEFLKD